MADEQLTGEAVALDVQPLGFFLRALGTVIDMLQGVAVLMLLAWVSGWLLGENIIDTSMSSIVGIVVIVLVIVVVPTAIETLSGGRSLGRWAVGGRIVRTDGGASGLRQALIRAIAGALELWMTVGCVAALSGAFTSRSQRLGDLMAGTYCQRVRTPALPADVPPLPPVLSSWAAVADVRRLPDRLARRLAQFVRQADALQPAARVRTATALAAEAADYAAPVPPVDPETFVRGVIAVRRAREHEALTLADRRVDALLAGVSAMPRDFPRR